MSAVAAPPSKTSGYRPPVLPPNLTTFAGGDESGGIPYHKLLAESVRQLMNSIKDAEIDALPMLRHLIDQRKRLIESELRLERMLQPAQPMPPMLFEMYGLDFLGQEEEPVRLYTRLLSTLDDAASKIDRRLEELNRELSASQLIDAGSRDDRTTDD